MSAGVTRRGVLKGGLAIAGMGALPAAATAQDAQDRRLILFHDGTPFDCPRGWENERLLSIGWAPVLAGHRAAVARVDAGVLEGLDPQPLARLVAGPGPVAVSLAALPPAKGGEDCLRRLGALMALPGVPRLALVRTIGEVDLAGLGEGFEAQGPGTQIRRPV